MNETNLRMTQSEAPPTPPQVEAWIGADAFGFWTRIATLIDRNYPNIFTPEWLCGGKKHGWSLRYKKGQSFCTLIPERNRCALLIVFGAEERTKVESIRHELSERSRKAYDDATTYHDGKWLLLTVDADAVIADVERLLFVKRRPRNVKHIPGQG